MERDAPPTVARVLEQGSFAAIFSSSRADSSGFGAGEPVERKRASSRCARASSAARSFAR
jgi:hypothetical protein